ncbi:MAG: class I SAM-dependent methyltransferase [Candidatus Methanomethylophilaceae archaeon]|nr:class I SAM-dependent methyltransferase [Candidatus Methanomethylophilaceae archaeon]
MKILDIGTGPGFFTINLTKMGHKAIGIDVTKEMVQVAEENAQEQGVECEFRVMNANSLDFPDNTFDLIINRVVTWTLPDTYECYREWRRVLAPNGRILVFDANHYANLFDEEKARTMRSAMREHVKAGLEPFTDHYDFHVRWTYWENCPMIGTPRPEWDRNMMFKLRFVDIIVDDNLFPDKDYDRGTSGPMFMVRAEKPNPDQENECIVNEYWNGIAGVVSGRASIMLSNGKAQTCAEEIAKRIPAGSKVLDLGTGSGNVAIPLSKMGYSVVGADRAFGMIEMAEITAEECGAPAEFAVADAYDLPFDDGSFDAVVMRNVVWNLFKPGKALKEAARVLKKGGKLIILDGNWQANIAKWKGSGSDPEIFPNYKSRDLGLGAYDVIEKYYAKLPLNSVSRPAWDKDVLGRCMALEECSPFEDPMITDDLKPVLGKGFILVFKK